MKYKLINRTTNKETLCDKVTIGDFDYYVSDEKSDFVYIPKDGVLMEEVIKCDSEEYRRCVRIFGNKNHKYVIATNNPNIDIPKVVDEKINHNISGTTIVWLLLIFSLFVVITILFSVNFWDYKLF